MNTEYKGIKISENARFENVDFVRYDFSMSDLSEVIFENVHFSNCTFNKTICKKTRFWGWYNTDNQSWALNCVNNIQKQAPAAIISWHDFKHFENEKFADELMELFRRAKESLNTNNRQTD